MPIARIRREGDSIAQAGLYPKRYAERAELVTGREGVDRIGRLQALRRRGYAIVSAPVRGCGEYTVSDAFAVRHRAAGGYRNPARNTLSGRPLAIPTRRNRTPWRNSAPGGSDAGASAQTT
jgi:hypothetical protein